MEAADWLVRFVGGATISLGILLLLAKSYYTLQAWNRRRPAYIKDYTDAREYMAVAVMLSRRCWTIRLPGSWIVIARPLYRGAADDETWDNPRHRVLFALAEARRNIDKNGA